MFDMNQWLGSPLGMTSTMDLFDPFDELDTMIGRNLQWLNRPDFLRPFAPRIPQKYRITVDCAGFRPESIKTNVQNNQLIVSGKEEERTPNSQDYTVRDFRKTYDLPANAQPDQLVSFMTEDGRLVIEVPLKETHEIPNADLFPQIVENKDGSKSVAMNFALPKDIDPSKVHLSVKDRDLIVRAEQRVDKPDRFSRYHFYQRSTLPENTKFDELKCVMDNNQIRVTAPIDMTAHRAYRSIPIEPRQSIKQA
jgi:HSP20 family molecular chaperone IbpA